MPEAQQLVDNAVFAAPEAAYDWERLVPSQDMVTKPVINRARTLGALQSFKLAASTRRGARLGPGSARRVIPLNEFAGGIAKVLVKRVLSRGSPIASVRSWLSRQPVSHLMVVFR